MNVLNVTNVTQYPFESEVESLCEQLNLKCRAFESTQMAYIDTEFDYWLLKVNDYNQVQLFHKNNGGNKMRVHGQRPYKDIKYAVMSIYTHTMHKKTGKDYRITKDHEIIVKDMRC